MSLLRALISTLAVLSACFNPTLGEAAARVRCNNDDECPGSSCVVEAARCKVAGASKNAPDIENLVFTVNEQPLNPGEPVLLGGGATVKIEFDVDADLLTDPVLRIGQQRYAIDVVGSRISTKLLVAEELPQGKDIVVDVELVGLGGGGVGSPVRVGQMTVDAEPPNGQQVWSLSILAGAEPTAGPALPGMRARACPITSEEDVLVAVVEIVAGDVRSPLDLNELCFEGRINALMPSGLASVDVTFVDLAGNTSVQTIAFFELAGVTTATCPAININGEFCTDGDADGSFGETAACPFELIGGPPDCDDTNAAVKPGAVEIGGNDIDENCDGQTPLASDFTLSEIFVDGAAEPSGDGSFFAPFATLQEAVNVQQGRPIYLAANTADTPYVIEGATRRCDEPAGSGLQLSGSLVGGFVRGDFWTATDQPSFIRDDSGSPRTLVVIAFRPTTLQNLDITTHAATAIELKPGPLATLSRVAIHSTVTYAEEDVACDAVGLDTQRDMIVTRSNIDVTCAGACLRGLAVRASTPIQTTIVDAKLSAASSVSATSIKTEADALIVRSSLTANGATGIGVDCSGGGCQLAGNVIRVTATTAGAGGRLLSGFVAHNTIHVDAVGATGFVVTGAVVAEANALVVRGNTSRFISLEPTGTVSARGNAVALGDLPCALRASDGTCGVQLMSDGCSEPHCFSWDGNVVWQDTAIAPAATVVALDSPNAPTSIAQDADGDCRGATNIEAGADEVP
jgi:hypothetical protein